MPQHPGHEPCAWQLLNSASDNVILTQATGMSCTNGMGLDMTSTPHDNLHLEDFRFTDLKWAKSSRMSKRWLVFFVRIKVCLPVGTTVVWIFDAFLHARGGTCHCKRCTHQAVIVLSRLHFL